MSKQCNNDYFYVKFNNNYVSINPVVAEYYNLRKGQDINEALYWDLIVANAKIGIMEYALTKAGLIK